MTDVIEDLLPSADLLAGIEAAARFGRGLRDETQVLIYAGMVSRLDEAGLCPQQALPVEHAIRRGDVAGIAGVYGQLVEAQSNKPTRRFDLVRVEGGEGVAIVPRGWSASMVDGELAILPLVTVKNMLRGLRSTDPTTRQNAGELLAWSLGRGLALSGLDELDIEHGVGKDLGALLARAMAGDAEAVDQLENIVTNDQSKAGLTPIESANDTRTSKGATE